MCLTFLLDSKIFEGKPYVLFTFFATVPLQTWDAILQG